jgi:hypothetical protein
MGEEQPPDLPDETAETRQTSVQAQPETPQPSEGTARDEERRAIEEDRRSEKRAGDDRSA